MKYNPVSSDFYTLNRQNLIQQLTDNSLVIIRSSPSFPRNGDQFFRFRQDSDFFYLTGIDQDNSALIIWKGSLKTEVKILLFIEKADKNQEIWYGRKLTPSEASNSSGIETVKYIDEYKDWICNFALKSKNLYVIAPKNYPFELDAFGYNLLTSLHCKGLIDSLKIRDLQELIVNQRLIKSVVEIQQIEKAVSITRQAYFSVLKTLKPKQMEYEIEAQISYDFLRNGASGHAYLPIVAGGVNACILHYTENDKMLKDGDLLLMDFGAEYGNYAADCSRTIPVNGIFSARQRALYQAVLDVYKRLITLFVPGNTIEKINQQAGLWLEEKMVELGLLSLEEVKKGTVDSPAYRKYFMHGTSHFLGLDVHDVGNKQTVFQKGMVLTCEPGLYIEEENIGIRIETNIVVDEIPIDLMADFPVEIDDIEAAMKG